MDTPATPVKPVRINRWLPYWAVFQADVHQTLRSWVFRTWLLLSILAATGYLLYRLGVYREAKIIQSSSELISDLLRWTVIGSVSLIIILTAGSISSERGSLADSVLSRGISRYQYFLGKWHARLFTILSTFLVMGVLWLTASHFLLHEDIQLDGAALALAVVAALLGAVITFGVSVSAMTTSTVLAIAVLWMGLYGASFLLSLLPDGVLAIDRSLQRLPFVLRGQYNLFTLGRLLLWVTGFSFLTAVAGMSWFSRRDV
jgi:ABC-2 type transport system permease protein